MNKLAKYIIIAVTVALIAFLVWYFSEIVWYLLISAVIFLIGKPLATLLTSFSIKKFRIPNWLASAITLLAIFSAIGLVFFFLTPIIMRIVSAIGQIDFDNLLANISEPFTKLNYRLTTLFPSLGEDFRIEAYLIEQVKESTSISIFTRAFSSIASFTVDLAIGIFSVVFISFFFLQERNLVGNMLNALVPDKYEANMKRALSSAEHLLRRYFTGIFIESILITILNTIGLYFIAGFDFDLAVMVAFASGVLNVIPYVGPLTGELLGVLAALMAHYSTPDAGPVLPFLLLTLGVMLTTQLIDNYLFQPFIYSSSVKAHPLEIFIVILIAGYVGGVIGMLIAIPAYTVIRVFAGEFLSHFKVVQRLTKNIKGIGEDVSEENASGETNINE
ncbi:MAG: AI-2E family transporter [Bacteroidales bacterium]|nr:AI-2E family transporter [Bacteroidales bacterium]